METAIRINVYLPGHSIKEIRIHHGAKVKNLNLIFGGTELKFLHNGTVLNNNFTLDTYGIKSGDTIIAAPCVNDSEKLKNLSLKSNFLKRISVSTCKEMIRLSDIKKAVAESKPKRLRSLYAKINRAWEAERERNYQETKKFETVIPPKPEMPSSEEIKICWGSQMQVKNTITRQGSIADEKLFNAESLEEEKLF
jgi:hypothetical protein